MQAEHYFENNYFDIRDILASQERISCKFEMEIPNMGRTPRINALKKIVTGLKT
jgi:hypothetical protein